jgi:hypothetical protein
MNKTLSGVFLACVAALPGCLLAAGAAVGVGVIVVTAEDTAEVVLERDVTTVYEAALAEVDIRGKTFHRNPEFHRFEGTVGDSDVSVDVVPYEKERTKLRIRARKLGGTLPDASLARSLSNAIVDELHREERDSGE